MGGILAIIGVITGELWGVEGLHGVIMAHLGPSWGHIGRPWGHQKGHRGLHESYDAVQGTTVLKSGGPGEGRER